MKFSIITPTYNRAHTIVRAIKSIQTQSYKNWELIIVDDGSTDNTYEVIKPILLGDKRVRYFKLDKNRGVGAARNYGLKNISKDSEWITFLDSDDIFVENALELMIKKIKEFPNIKHFSFSTIYENGKRACKIPYDNFIGNYEIVLGKDNLVKGEFNPLLHRTIIEDGFKFEESVNGYEWIAWLRLAKKGYKILYTTTTTTRIYITSGESLIRTKNKNTKFYENVKKGIEIILNEFGEDLKKVNKKKYALYLSWYGLSLIKTNNIKKGLNYTLQSLKFNPLELRNFRNVFHVFIK